MVGTIFDIKEMAVHDGPGIRTTVFFKGCPLRCAWCHNPEGLTREKQLMVKTARCTHCGKCHAPCSHAACQPFGRCLYVCPEGLVSVSGRQVDAAELATELRESARPLGDAFGGFTFSGGEPLMQSDFLLQLCDELAGYPLCVETGGYAPGAVFEAVIRRMDYVIMDIKLADNDMHKTYTGAENTAILQNFHRLADSGIPYLIRTPLVPRITDTPDNLRRIRDIIGHSDWEQLPYNDLAPMKYAMLGMPYPL